MGVVGESYFKMPPYSLKENGFYLRNEFYNKIKSNKTNFLKTLFLNFKLSLNSAIFKLISL
ncbi:hypothetical protein C2R59_03765 [Helicobacter pylori]|nr:hypothetical protein C2R59_03765 [Helicobacter pylori]